MIQTRENRRKPQKNQNGPNLKIRFLAPEAYFWPKNFLTFFFFKIVLKVTLKKAGFA